MALTFRSFRKNRAAAPKEASHSAEDLSLEKEPLCADPRFLEQITPEFAIRNDIVPLGRHGGLTLIAAASYERFQTTRASLEATLGPVAHIAADISAIRAATAAIAGPMLANKAVTHTSLRESCRGWSGTRTAINLG